MSFFTRKENSGSELYQKPQTFWKKWNLILDMLKYVSVNQTYFPVPLYLGMVFN